MPTEWTILYILFLMTFLIFNIINYFNQSPKNKPKSNRTITANKANWKW